MESIHFDKSKDRLNLACLVLCILCIFPSLVQSQSIKGKDYCYINGDLFLEDETCCKHKNGIPYHRSEVFLGSNYYHISVDVGTEDIIDEYTLSYGTFTEINDTIVLVDELVGYEMILIKKNGHLQFTHSLSLLEDKSYTYHSSCETNVNRHILPKADVNNFHQLYEQKLKDEDVSVFKTGCYQESNFYNRFRLKLNEDKSYQFEYDGMCVSHGKWERKKNTIYLYDKKVNGPFIVFIHDNKIMVGFLPGIVRPLLLKPFPIR